MCSSRSVKVAGSISAVPVCGFDINQISFRPLNCAWVSLLQPSLVIQRMLVCVLQMRKGAVQKAVIQEILYHFYLYSKDLAPRGLLSVPSVSAVLPRLCCARVRKGYRKVRW